MIERIVPKVMLVLTRDGPQTRPVKTVDIIPAGPHRGIPIRDEYVAVKVTVDTGERRYFGFRRAWIGSDLKVHVYVNPRDEVRIGWPLPTGAARIGAK